MIRPKKILFPTDFSRCADQAFSHALYLAGEFDAEVHMLHAVILHEKEDPDPEHRFLSRAEVEARLSELVHGYMEQTWRMHEVNDVHLRRVELQGISAAPLILQYARDHGIDLIVMGTHGRRGLGHLFLGSVAEEVVRLAPSPVLIVREKAQPVPTPEAVRRVLVPIDFSGYARGALACAKEIADLYDARLQLLHVIEEPIQPAFYGMGAPSFYDLVPDIEERVDAELKTLFEMTAGPEVRATFHVMHGRAARDVVRFAERNETDLVVLATHGLTGLEHLFMGSVAEKVVRLAPCPVFVVKPYTVKEYDKAVIRQEEEADRLSNASM